MAVHVVRHAGLRVRAVIGLRVDVRDTAVLASLRNGAKRQAYAISNALNATAKAIQKSIPAHMKRSGFVVRKTAFMFGRGGPRGGVANKITDFANAGARRLMVRVAVDPPEEAGGKRRLLLPRFEHGGARHPMTPGAKSVAVPLLGRPARPSLAQGVPPAYTFAGMRFVKYVAGKKVTKRQRGRHTRDVGILGEYGRVSQPRPQEGSTGSPRVEWRGNNRTFLLTQTKKAPRGGVFQRIGRGRGGVRLLYAFVAPPHLDNRLKFEQNAAAVTQRTFRRELYSEIQAVFKYHGRS